MNNHINTTKHQEQQPEPLKSDLRGTVIEVGRKIAYNFSGDVAIGAIVNVKRNEWKIARPGTFPKNWWYLKFEIEVQHENGKISKIKNPNSFVIIDF